MTSWLLQRLPGTSSTWTSGTALARWGSSGADDRVELIDGEIVDMSPIGSRHAASVDRLNSAPRSARSTTSAIVRVQGPVRLSRLSEPLPDLAILKFRADFYSTAKPGPSDVLVMVEVADSSIGLDLGAKALLYAQNGIPEYWVVDLNADVVHVLTGPGPGGYGATATTGRDGALVPRLLPAVSVAVSTVLGLD